MLELPSRSLDGRLLMPQKHYRKKIRFYQELYSAISTLWYLQITMKMFNVENLTKFQKPVRRKKKKKKKKKEHTKCLRP